MKKIAQWRTTSCRVCIARNYE